MSVALTDITQEQYDAAEATILALIRAAYPNLDMRRGTVLRDLLLRPAAQTVARDSELMEELRQKQSLVAMQENEATLDPDDVNAILSNFNMTREAGAYAAGRVKVIVSSDRTYVVAEDVVFTSLSGATYTVTAGVVAKSNPDTLLDEQQLYQSEDGQSYYFFVDVIATEPGAEYTLQAGDALNTSTSLFGFVTAEAYTDFSPGLDDETISEAIARIPAAISYRALESPTSIEAKLRDNFADASFQIQEIAVRGYGDLGQLRDKHNPMGFAVGSRVDVYIKTFTEPTRLAIRKTGRQIGMNTYQIDIDASDAPGYYMIRSVSEVETTVAPAVGFGELPTHGSYAFEEVRQPYGVADTFHDIDETNIPEIAFSVFQQGVVVVTGVPYTDAEREFKVELYVAPGVADMQAYVDSYAVRNLEADYIIRCPLVCNVELETIVRYDPRSPVNVDTMRQNLAALINNKHFGQVLTRSELVNQLLSDGATHVDLSETTGMKLRGYVMDGAGTLHRIERDDLDITYIQQPDALLVPETVVFGAELDNIVIETIPDA